MAANIKEDPELERFLSNVDQVTNVIESLAKGDEDANEKADMLLKETIKKEKKENLAFNSSRINKYQDEQSPPQPGMETQSKDGWMEEIALDAERRAKSRKERKMKSDKIKEKGNKRFSEGKYEEAYKLYTDASDIMKDNLAIWTNRAQVLIKLERYEEAIADCDFAFRIDEKCLKAFVHKSRALAHMNKFEDARKCLDEALEWNPTSKATIAQYLSSIDEMEKCFQLSQQANKAKESFSEDYKTISSVLEAIKQQPQRKHPIIFYVGAIDYLSQLISTEKDKIIFRTELGFETVTNIPFLKTICANDGFSKHFRSQAKTIQEEVSLISSFLSLLHHVCVDCLSNFQYICKNLPQILRNIVTLIGLQDLEVNIDDAVLEAVKYLNYILPSCLLRKELLGVVEQKEVIENVNKGFSTNSVSVLQLKCKLINIMLTEKAFRKTITVQHTVPIDNILFLLSHPNQPIVLQGLAFVSNFINIENFKTVIAQNDACFERLMKLASKNGGGSQDGDIDDIRVQSMTLIQNFLILNNEFAKIYADNLVSLCDDTLKGVMSRKNSCCITNIEKIVEESLNDCFCDETILLCMARVFEILRQVYNHCGAKFSWNENNLTLVTSSLVHSSLLYHNKNDEQEAAVTSYCDYFDLALQNGTTLLALLIQNSSVKQRLEYAEKFDPKLDTILNFVLKTGNAHSKDVSSAISRISCANVALILGYFFESKKICVGIMDSHHATCKDLLSIASNHSNEKIRANVAIAISRLVSNDNRQLIELRKLEGLKILHDCMKFVDM